MFIKPKIAKIVAEELYEAERQLLVSIINQQKAVTAISVAEADLIIKNATLSYYQGLVKSLKGLQEPTNQ